MDGVSKDVSEMYEEVRDYTYDQVRAAFFFLVGYCDRRDIVEAIEHVKRVKA